MIEITVIITLVYQYNNVSNDLIVVTIKNTIVKQITMISRSHLQKMKKTPYVLEEREEVADVMLIMAVVEKIGTEKVEVEKEKGTE